MWTSSADGAKRLSPMPALPLGETAPAGAIMLRVDVSREYQEIDGFGAAMTDASAYLIEDRMNERQRDTLLIELFDQKVGLGLNFVRLTIGASDFSREHYSYDDMPAGEEDPELVHFSIEKARAHVIPAIIAARAVNPGILLMATPWSAPGWMKTSNSLIKGGLAERHYSAFAKYLDRYIADMAAEGLSIDFLSIQNEPHFEPDDYPGMHMETSARAHFIGGYLGPLLIEKGRKTRILDWDHNWDEPESPLGVLANEKARHYVYGVAWHCYKGDVAAQSAVRDAYPDQHVYFTECSGGKWVPEWGSSLAWIMRDIIIGTTRNWARSVLLWNLALDEKHGPHLGGCSDCHGVVTINSTTGEVTRNIEYYALGHVSRFVRRGARRIASDSDVEGLYSVAFRNVDDGSLVLVVLNDSRLSRILSVRQGERGFHASMAAGDVTTFVWQ